MKSFKYFWELLKFMGHSRDNPEMSKASFKFLGTCSEFLGTSQALEIWELRFLQSLQEFTKILDVFETSPLKFFGFKQVHETFLKFRVSLKINGCLLNFVHFSESSQKFSKILHITLKISELSWVLRNWLQLSRLQSSWKFHKVLNTLKTLKVLWSSSIPNTRRC